MLHSVAVYRSGSRRGLFESRTATPPPGRSVISTQLCSGPLALALRQLAAERSCEYNSAFALFTS